LAMIGWTRKSRNALAKIVSANRGMEGWVGRRLSSRFPVAATTRESRV
jgi:hypothetical protein